MGQKLIDTTQLFSGNFIFAEELYQKYLTDPSSVDSSWKEFFETNADDLNLVINDYKGPSWKNRTIKVIGGEDFDISSVAKKELPKDLKGKDLKAGEKSAAQVGSHLAKDLKIHVLNLILAYKRYAHLACKIDPLGLVVPENVIEITPQYHGIEESDLNSEVDLSGILGLRKAKISEVISKLNSIYKNTIGCEFEYIRSDIQKNWLAASVESAFTTQLSKDEKVKILKEIVRTERFEQFLHKRFPGAKRFSVEGGDAVIPVIEKIIDNSARNGVRKIVIGMAHRGRLNTLTGVMKKPYHEMIAEFQGTPGMPEGVTKSGDVKYHMGYANTREIDGKKVDISLAFNPSHLEAVNSVVTGRVRAKQDLYGDNERTSAMAIVIHGDAAFAGQGSVAENLMMNGVKGYNTGGVMHIIINNQIGFTANPNDSRSTTYASDLARAIDAPIFHINGDDAESAVKIAGIVAEYRQKFGKDVVVDLVCYRKYGHNEGDEPLYTQPIMYTVIKDHPTLENIYSKKLIAEGVVLEADYQKIVSEFESHLQSEFELASKFKPVEADWLKADWSKIKDGDNSVAKTAVANKKLQEIIKKITEVPANFNVNPKIARQLEARRAVVEAGKDIDWGTAESLAFASLLTEGYPVRITGQDSGRGTFSHRHSVLHDAVNAARYYPLNNLGEKAARYEVHDSVLSEFAVLGFEYGYSLSTPYGLTIWEAQFGDFANGAQIIFDQFIASSEVKWLRKSNLVMLLPHGYEGQGPEHSSARLERYLQACADNNLRVVNITNPANFFHALRRQLYSKDRKPLVVMSPKSLLRHKLAVSTLDEFSEIESFKPVIGEIEKLAADKVKKVIICSGKVYYDLLEARNAKKISDIALIRLEQFYPFPDGELAAEIKKYKNAEIVWCQEEPRNMGGWNFVAELIEEVLINVKAKSSRPKYVGRIASASPATGYGKYHTKELAAFIDEALNCSK